MEPIRSSWALILAIWVAGLGAAAQYGKISVVFDHISAYYPQAGASIGFAVSLVGFLGIVLGVVAGSFVAAIGYRRTLVLALWLGALMSALQAVGLPFWLFLLSRIVEGMSHLGVVVAGPTLIAQFSAPRSRGFAMTLWSTFFAVSFALLAWLGRPLVEAFGVPTLFAAHGGIMAGLAVLLTAMTRRDMIADRLDMPRLNDLPGLHLGIYRSARLFAPAAGWLFYTFCFVSMLTVLPPYIVESNRSFVMAAMPLMGMAVSMTLGVALLRWLSAVRVVQLGFALSAVASVWLWVDTGAPMACLAVAGAMGLVQGGSFAAIAQLNQSAPDRALASGAMAQTGNLGNTIGTPIMVLVLSVIGYGGMMTVLIAMFASGLAVHTLLARRV